MLSDDQPLLEAVKKLWESQTRGTFSDPLADPFPIEQIPSGDSVVPESWFYEIE